MLVIRLQRTGRKGHAMFRVVVQDSRRTPTSGKVVAWLGSYDPHAKSLSVNKEKASFYLEHGAQPSDRIAKLLKDDGVKLPNWVAIAADRQRAVRNAEKRRSTRAEEPEAPKEEAAASEEPAAETEEATPAEETTEAPAETTEPEAKEAPAAEEAQEEPNQAEEPQPTAEEPAKEASEEASVETKEPEAPEAKSEETSEPEKAEESK